MIFCKWKEMFGLSKGEEKRLVNVTPRLLSVVELVDSNSLHEVS